MRFDTILFCVVADNLCWEQYLYNDAAQQAVRSFMRKNICI